MHLRVETGLCSVVLVGVIIHFDVTVIHSGEAVLRDLMLFKVCFDED